MVVSISCLHLQSSFIISLIYYFRILSVQLGRSLGAWARQPVFFRGWTMIRNSLEGKVRIRQKPNLNVLFGG
jgi:hypothetical protein